jgi:osmotically-inducible protein OsmY
MTTFVVTAEPDTPLHEIAELMERHGVKRIPIVQQGQVIGIVSRANLVQALASGVQGVDTESNDEALREAVVSQLSGQPWGQGMINVIVHDGEVDLWGVVDNAEEKKAVRIVAERIPGVRCVNDNLRIYRVSSGV